MWGIDVSHHQGSINWMEVRMHGIQFAIMKVMLEKSHILDSRYEYNWYQAGLNNIERGAYLYSVATNIQEAQSEARDFVRLLNGRTLERGVWLDIEDAKIRGLSKDVLTTLIETEADIIRAAGYSVGIYSNLDWYLHVLDGQQLIRRHDWWLARYPKGDDGTLRPVLRPSDSFAIWQYSSKGVVQGIRGPVDMDIDVSDLGKTNEQVAEEVLDGKWGNGQVRINRLTASGYDVTLVQQIVNQLIHDRKYYPKYNGLSMRIDEVFRKIGVEEEYIGNKSNRFPIAVANDIGDYSGTLLQNLKLISLAKSGQLKRP